MQHTNRFFLNGVEQQVEVTPETRILEQLR